MTIASTVATFVVIVLFIPGRRILPGIATKAIIFEVAGWVSIFVIVGRYLYVSVEE
ncbi:hypothetical protein BDV30DRAFT_202984 [Aspergillus minisclerotigenes]|uniref:Uncharacterized protein n=1 Tax=Aspergillus minisclerotigenes TaxID=656917 RepID=A0A5N6JJ81_9EURO|nr:hypothetical protein BDV30DRAFT_202984 [Aspergillus minisclerotigenes]